MGTHLLRFEVFAYFFSHILAIFLRQLTCQFLKSNFHMSNSLSLLRYCILNNNKGLILLCTLFANIECLIPPIWIKYLRWSDSNLKLRAKLYFWILNPEPCLFLLIYYFLGMLTYSRIKQLLLIGQSFIYLVAFTSLYWQIPGLYGERGLLPIATRLKCGNLSLIKQKSIFHPNILISSAFTAPVFYFDHYHAISFRLVMDVVIKRKRRTTKERKKTIYEQMEK